MPSKEIKELRQAGKLEEALSMAEVELKQSPDDIWSKRNISWVYYEYLKSTSSSEQFDSFIKWLKEIYLLRLPDTEKMLYDNLSWQIGKMVFSLSKATPFDPGKAIQVFEIIQHFHFTKPSESYSFLFKSLHKNLKDTDSYFQLADWWDFNNFQPEDFQKSKLENGNEMMAIAEQAYIAYSRHLLPRHSGLGDVIFNREKALSFLPILSSIVEQYPQFQYPPYFKAKLLLALGNKENILSSLLPFAKTKRDSFWVWEMLAEAFPDKQDILLACYCKALSCKSPAEMLINLRQKMAGVLIARKLFKEAKTEIALLIQARINKGYKIPNEIINWESEDWYQMTECATSNFHFYKKYLSLAESLLFSDIEEETVIVEFVNMQKQILNFIASENKYGFFKYDRFLNDVRVGDILKVRFQNGIPGGKYQLFTAIKIQDETFKAKYLKEVNGKIKIPSGKSFAFLENVFIHPSIVVERKLIDGMQFSGTAIKSYNLEKKQWGWKLIDNI